MSEKKSIWMINHFAISPMMPGGTRHYDFGVELVKRGYDVKIFASDFNYTNREHTKLRFWQLKSREYYNDVEFVWLNTIGYKKNNWKRMLNMLSFAFNACLVGYATKKANLIIGSSPHLFAAFAGYVIAKLKRCQFYLEVRDLWPQTMIEGGSVKEGSVVVKILRIIEHFLYKNSSLIIVLAKGAGKYIEEKGIESQKILFLPNGVHLEHFKVTEPREKVRQHFNLKGKFVVMYAGAHGQLNALHTIIDAAQLMQDNPKVVFVSVGDGPEKNNLMESVQAKGLTNVMFVPPVSKAEVPNLLNAADALVITLLNVDLFSYGVSPNKLFDYMAARKPVICAVSGEMSKLVMEADAGITVEPEKPDELAKAVLDLIEKPERCATYGINGRRFVERNFSRRQLLNELLQKLN